MGCSGAKAAATRGDKSARSAAGTADVRAAAKSKLNPKDYVISKCVDAVVVRDAGSIAGEQFNIEECKGCDIFLLDHVATVFIDECENCRIFIGAVEGSVMVRNCCNCSLQMACQQFRSRDCADCRFALMCTTEPIIESSSNMQFACFDFRYFSLRSQLHKAGLAVWNNKWWQIYDFNKNPVKANWSRLPQEEVQGLLRPELSGLPKEELQMERIVPLTLGNRENWPTEESCILLLLPGAEDCMEPLMTKADRSPDWNLCRTRSMALGQEQLRTLLSLAQDPKHAVAKGKEIQGIEICGPGIAGKVQAFLASGTLPAGRGLKLVPVSETAALGKLFFETWKDEV